MARGDKEKEKKQASSSNGEFKISPMGFDKGEVMAYIGQQNKARKSLQEEVEKLQAALEAEKAKPSAEQLEAEVAKKKKELDEQIIESRKQINDERRKLAQTEKQLHVLQDSFKALEDEFAQYKKKATKRLAAAAQNAGGSAGVAVDTAAAEEFAKKTAKDANAMIADAKQKASRIISSAVDYYNNAAAKIDTFKNSVLQKSEKVPTTATAASGSAVDIDSILNSLLTQINAAVATAVKTAQENAAANAALADITISNDDTETDVARAELAMLTAEQLEPEAIAVMDVGEYSFSASSAMGSTGVDDLTDEDDDDLTADHDNGLLSSFSVVSSGVSVKSDSSDTFSEEDVVLGGDFTDMTASTDKADDDFGDLLADTSAPAATDKADDDFSHLLADAPATAPAATDKADDDFSDLLADAPATAPAATDKADDDFSDLLADAPTAAPAPAESADVDFTDLLADVSPSDMGTGKADDDFSDLLADAPATAPAATDKADDDFSDLLADAPAPAPAPAEYKPVYAEDNTFMKPETSGGVIENLNESLSMGVAGEDTTDDPWKDLESQMNGATFTTPPSKKNPEAAGDEMSASFGDIDEDDSADGAGDGIDMSDYSTMMGEEGELVNANVAQYDPSWDFKLMEGMAGEEGDGDEEEEDEMSSDSGGFFDL